MWELTSENISYGALFSELFDYWCTLSNSLKLFRFSLSSWFNFSRFYSSRNFYTTTLCNVITSSCSQYFFTILLFLFLIFEIWVFPLFSCQSSSLWILLIYLKKPLILFLYFYYLSISDLYYFLLSSGIGFSSCFSILVS